MRTQLLLLRISYWIGIFLDAGAAILLMFPQLSAQFYGWTRFTPSPELSSLGGTGAALMLGWTFLLFWADRKPFERKGILLLTVFPVLFGLYLRDWFDAQAGLSSFHVLTNIRTYLILLFSFSYWFARKER